jgi:hypothetical protein
LSCYQCRGETVYFSQCSVWLWTGRSGFDLRQGLNISSLACVSRLYLLPIQPPIRQTPSGREEGIALSGREAELSHLVTKSAMSRNYVRFQVTTETSVKMKAFLNIVPCCLVKVQRLSRNTYCFYITGGHHLRGVYCSCTLEDYHRRVGATLPLLCSSYRVCRVTALPVTSWLD